MELLEFEYINGFRSSSLLVYTTDEKQIYKKNNNYNKGRRYVCYHKNCYVSVFIDDKERCRKKKDSPLHEHSNQEAVKDKMLLSQKIKNACKDAAETGRSMRDIFEEECRNEGKAAHLVEYGKMRRNLYRIKKNKLPTNPSEAKVIKKLDLQQTKGHNLRQTKDLQNLDSVPSGKTKHEPKQQDSKHMEFLEFEYINGFRSSSMLVYTTDEKHIYKKHNNYNNGTRYQCYSKNCGISIFIDEQGKCKKLNDLLLHNHPTQDITKEKMLMSQKIKNACRNSSIKKCSTREIFDEACRNESYAANLLEYGKMKRNLCRIKKSVLQKNQTMTEDLENKGEEQTEEESNLVQSANLENIAIKQTIELPPTSLQSEDLNNMNVKSIYSDESSMSNDPWPTENYQNIYSDETVMSENATHAKDFANIYSEETTMTNCDSSKYDSEDVKLFDFEQINVCLQPKDPLLTGDTHNIHSAPMVLLKSSASSEDLQHIGSDEITITKCELNETNTSNVPFLEFEYINGFRSSSRLVYTKYEKQIYKKKNFYNKGTRYECYLKNCGTSVFIDDQERCKKLSDNHSHNHPTQELLKNKMQISQNIKNACKDESLKRRSARDIFEEECRNEENSAYLVQFKKMRRNLYRIKNSAQLKNPKPHEESTSKDSALSEDVNSMNSEEVIKTTSAPKEIITTKKPPTENDSKTIELLEFEYINGFRSSSMLVYTKDEKQIYKKHNNYNKGCRYVCYNKNCFSSIFIDDQGKCRKLNGSRLHNHPTQEILKDKMLMSQKIKNACKNASIKDCSTREIFEEACRNEEKAAHLVEYEKMRGNLSRIKRNALPKSPLSLEYSKNTDLEVLMPKHKLAKNDPKTPEFFEFEYIHGFRSSSLLVYTKDEKQIYRRNNVYNKGRRYVCYSKNCGMAVFVDKHERCKKLSDFHSHNHPTQEVLRDKMVISHKIKNACMNASKKECTAREVFEEELRNEKNSAHLVDFKKMKRNLCRLKNSLKPKKQAEPKKQQDLKNIVAEKTKIFNNSQSRTDLKDIGVEDNKISVNPLPSTDHKNIGTKQTSMVDPTRPTLDVINVVSQEIRMPCNNPWLSADLQTIGADDARMSSNYNPWQWQGGVYHR